MSKLDVLDRLENFGYRDEERREPLTRLLELPLFDGEDAEGWLTRVEQYFELSEFSEEEKLRAVRMCFTNDALSWYHWERDRHPFLTWEQMKSRVLENFAVSHDLTAGERLLLLRQDESAGKYCKDFIFLAANAPKVSEKVLEMAFMIGLKPKVRAGVKMFEPRNLKKMMSVAKMVEEWNDHGDMPSSSSGDNTNRAANRSGGERLPTRVFSHVRGGVNVTNTKPPIPPENKTTQFHTIGEKTNPNQGKPAETRRAPYRRLSDTEANDHRAKGLLLVATVDDEEGEVDKDENELGEELVEVPEFTALSIYLAVGISSPRTMKLRGIVQEEDIVVMVDSGATHNFISSSMENRIGIATKGVCHNVKLQLHGYAVVTSFLPLELGEANVILGMQWLETLGHTKVNWKEQRLGFWAGTEWVTLRGDHSLQNSEVSLKSLWKALQQDGEGILVDCHNLQAVKGETKEDTLALYQPLFEEFSMVFAEPTGLPPSRGKEHPINLKPSAEPVSVRPFCYPHAQKEEIEKQIAVMLAARIIRESGSPFSSPVLLVKKKDGSWRFCVDYRTLNKVTVPDSYPIPMIDQLLDELHGAQIFSKLDLRSGYHQILVKAEDVQKTTFRSRDGHYEFLVMPFGLTNAPATLQSLMNEVFRPFLRKFVLVFFDDILVYSRTIQEHQGHLRAVLATLKRHKLYANQKKCQFGSQQIEYLGHVITPNGVVADPRQAVATG
ncbi:PREDICTED: uncharacterized protein LOC104779138 [Camelina sativa]|uniref:Uncharacterized protein LOC104779138 n=1 Tax=Camelina sativa TaxID=90675 RepID=A0ABM0YJA6_CAMSA|nr:PREDICTED: uncharacterized protein LOC104779138 [Camelina sativa]